MFTKKHTALAPLGSARDPLALLRRMSAEMDRMFEVRWPSLRSDPTVAKASWLPEIDVFQRDNRLVTKVDLPGMKREDVKVQVTEGHLTISGERRTETDDKNDQYYRCEREYGTFYRAIPLPEGVQLEDIKATFIDGVLEVSMPVPVHAEDKVRTVEIEDAPKAAPTAA